jgi:hypothetical protein
MYSLKQITISIFVTITIIGGGLYLYIPTIVENNVIQKVIENSKETVKQLQIVREYYTKYIVADVKKNGPELVLDYDHKDFDTKLPFPTTVIHDLTSMYSLRSKVKFEFYSEYPFLNRKDRVLSPFQKEAIKMLEKNDDGIYVKKDNIDGQKVLRVAIADYMILPACVNCHNSHKLKNWDSNKWKLGDKRGIIEIITPLN